MLIQDLWNRRIRLTDERLSHLETDHPEMRAQVTKIVETLSDPDRITRSTTDQQVEMFYKHYSSTPVTTKFLCVILKALPDDGFIITSYFTDTVKKGEVHMGEEVKVWYDREADYLEVLFDRKEGYFRETDNDAVMEKVDDQGNVIGFSILKVSAISQRQPLSVSLSNRVA